MTELHTAIAAERINKQIRPLPDSFREKFRSAIKNLIQSGYLPTQEPITDERELLLHISQRQPVLASIWQNPEQDQVLRLQAHKEFQANEIVLRKKFG